MTPGVYYIVVNSEYHTQYYSNTHEKAADYLRRWGHPEWKVMRVIIEEVD